MPPDASADARPSVGSDPVRRVLFLGPAVPPEMAIDPSEYDVVGLRELARGEDPRSGVGSCPRAGGAVPAPEGLAEPDRQVSWLGSHDERHKPYLRRIPRRDDLQRVLREWLERLVDRVGPGGAAEALGHYERLGWITESVEAELRTALPDPDGGDRGSLEDLSRVDHVHSLSVVALSQLGAEGERLAAERVARRDPAARSAVDDD